MNITITITDASPEDLETITSFVEQMQSRGVEVEAPQEQAQEPQEDHLAKIAGASITCEYDADVWVAYARKHLLGREYRMAYDIVDKKLLVAKGYTEDPAPYSDLSGYRRKYRAISKEHGIHPKVHELLKIKGGSSVDWSAKTLNALCEKIPMGPTEYDYCQMRDFTREMELAEWSTSAVERIIEERIKDGRIQCRPWLLHLLCNWNDHFPMHQTILKFAGNKAPYAKQLREAYNYQTPDLRRNKPTLDQWLKDFDESNVDSAEIETFYNRCHQLLQDGVQPATLYKKLREKVQAGSYNPATVVKFLWSIRSLEDRATNEKSQPRGETGPFVR